jgi:hypothetical protein
MVGNHERVGSTRAPLHLAKVMFLIVHVKQRQLRRIDIVGDCHVGGYRVVERRGGPNVQVSPHSPNSSPD